jgi:hypothetical protein
VTGRSDIDGQATRVGARMEQRGREQHRWAKPRGRSEREHTSQSLGSERVSIKKGMFDVRGLMFDVKQ